MKLKKIISLVLFSAMTIVLALGNVTNVSAASSSFVGKPGNAGQTEVTSGGLQIGTDFVSKDGAQSPFADASRPEAVYDYVVGGDQINEVIHFKNVSGKELSLNTIFYLPSSDKGTQYTIYTGNEPSVPSNITATYDYHNVGGYASAWDQSKGQNVSAIHLNGKVPANQEVTITLPLKIQNYKPYENRDGQLLTATNIIGGWNNYTDGARDSARVQLDISEVSKLNNIKTLTNLRYYAGIWNKEMTVWTPLPEKIQNLMPKYNSDNEMTYDNWRAGYGTANDSVLYDGGKLYVELTQLKDSVREVGYSVPVLPNDHSKLYDHFTYSTNSGFIYPEDPNHPGNDKPYGPIYASFRLVVDTKDYTLPLNSKWDNTKDVKVYDHEAANVDVNSKDVKITGNVDTSKPGQYKIKYTYLPDNVSNTQIVTVAGDNNNGGNDDNDNGNNSNNGGNKDNNNTGKGHVNNTTKKVTHKLPQTGEMNTALLTVSGIIVLSALTAAYVLNKKVRN